ncbi:MAG: hypothetical protein OEW33_16925 [Nitrospirota bacterium]|nr:hypothetical protein [Nitrospirota bacterium]
MERRDEKKPGSATPVAVAAALTMLGMSVGVNVPDLFAASPPDQIESKQEKISPILQGKEINQVKGIGNARQGKIESLQNKPAGSLQHKVQPIQGKPPSVQNKPPGVVK